MFLHPNSSSEWWTKNLSAGSFFWLSSHEKHEKHTYKFINSIPKTKYWMLDWNFLGIAMYCHSCGICNRATYSSWSSQKTPLGANLLLNSILNMSVVVIIWGQLLKWWVSPTTMGFPTKNDHFGLFWGYHHCSKKTHIDAQLFTNVFFENPTPRYSD